MCRAVDKASADIPDSWSLLSKSVAIHLLLLVYTRAHENTANVAPRITANQHKLQQGM